MQQFRAKASCIIPPLPEAQLLLKPLMFSPKLEPNLSLIIWEKSCRILLWLQVGLKNVETNYFALRKLSRGFGLPQVLQEFYTSNMGSWIFGQDYRSEMKSNI